MSEQLKQLGLAVNLYISAEQGKLPAGQRIGVR